MSSTSMTVALNQIRQQSELYADFMAAVSHIAAEETEQAQPFDDVEDPDWFIDDDTSEEIDDETYEEVENLLVDDDEEEEEEEEDDGGWFPL